MFDSQDRKLYSGLLMMHLGVAAVLLLHALPKLFDGACKWKSVGLDLNSINVGLPPVVFGFGILLLEASGAVSFVFGYFLRTACTILFILFALCSFIYFQKPGYDTLMLWSLGPAAVLFGLIYAGPRHYAAAVKLRKK